MFKSKLHKVREFAGLLFIALVMLSVDLYERLRNHLTWRNFGMLLLIALTVYLLPFVAAIAALIIAWLGLTWTTELVLGSGSASFGTTAFYVIDVIGWLAMCLSFLALQYLADRGLRRLIPQRWVRRKR